MSNGVEDRANAGFDTEQEVVVYAPVGLAEAMRVIEEETRDGGQWGLRDVNEYARIILARAARRSTELRDALAGMVGLCQLLDGRDDLPHEVHEALRSSHRLITARVLLRKLDAET